MFKIFIFYLKIHLLLAIVHSDEDILSKAGEETFYNVTDVTTIFSCLRNKEGKINRWQNNIQMLYLYTSEMYTCKDKYLKIKYRYYNDEHIFKHNGSLLFVEAVAYLGEPGCIKNAQEQSLSCQPVKFYKLDEKRFLVFVNNKFVIRTDDHLKWALTEFWKYNYLGYILYWLDFTLMDIIDDNSGSFIYLTILKVIKSI